jgi:hypothetical protein
MTMQSKVFVRSSASAWAAFSAVLISVRPLPSSRLIASRCSASSSTMRRCRSPCVNFASSRFSASTRSSRLTGLRA